jgi:hypothetical protein
LYGVCDGLPEGQHATAEVVPELLLDEAGDWLASPSSLGQEGLELPPDDAVENALLGAAGRVRRLRRTARSAMRMGMTRKGLRFQPEAAVASFMPCSYPRAGARSALEDALRERALCAAFTFPARTPVHRSPQRMPIPWRMLGSLAADPDADRNRRDILPPPPPG